MQYQIISVYDKKAEVYGLPNFFAATGIAVRSFVDEINRPAGDNVLYRHPDDFVLYHLGTYDDTKPSFDMFPHAKEIARGNEVAVRDGVSGPSSINGVAH